ncbi:MAG: magnesium-translocating P-type ATPase [Nevskia sp.]|nr:magnesium-translocating P-type ATPase [Nevskia sp.]
MTRVPPAWPAFRRRGGEASRPPLSEFARLDAAACLRRLGSSPEGLAEAEAAARRRRIGSNALAYEKNTVWPLQLFQAFANPFSALLIVLALISAATGDRQGAVLLWSMVLLSSLLRFTQEFRSGRAAEKLRAMVHLTAAVKRAGDATFRERPLDELVPGDVLRLCAGDMVPADVRLLTAKDLFVSQSALTGEAFPVEKFAAPVAGGDEELALSNLCFMGSNVVSGAATAVVLATGAQTYLGGIGRELARGRGATEFDRGVRRFGWLLVVFVGVMAPAVFLINGLARHDWLEAFLFAIAVGVGLTPEMLPMIVTATLARGAVAMSREKVIVKRLDAIQNFGAMDVLCTDKTGTLTQDRIVLKWHVDVTGQESEAVLEHAYLNSRFQTGLKNLLDVAVLEHAEVAQRLDLARAYRMVDEIPFDFERRRMSVVVEEDRDHHELICKGAVEEVLAACSSVFLHGKNEPLDAARRAQALARARAYNEDGLRAIAVAYKETPRAQTRYTVADERDLTLLGFIAFLDPPKDSAAPALRRLAERGVAVKVLSGDNEVVTRKVCRDVGLATGEVLSGAQLERLDDAALAEAAERCTVFAKLAPLQKERVVRVLRARGRVVGFLGDGINDAPALRAADLGVSVDSAVDIAKASADIILLEKSLAVLERGVVEGRRTFSNIVKYIKMAASSNFGNMFSVVGASLLLPFLPMRPLQILVQNLLYDFSQTAIPFDAVDADDVARPRRWEVGGIARFMLWFGPISSAFDYAIFAVMWFAFGARTPLAQSLFQTGWFVEGLVSQTLIVHVIRTARRPFVDSRAAWSLSAATAAVAAFGLFVPYSPIAGELGFVPLPAAYFPWLVAILVAYAMATELLKRRLRRRFGPV